MSGSATNQTLQIVRLGKREITGLCDLLAAIAAAGEGEHFRPHPFGRAHINELARRRGQDLYYVVTLDDRVAGYGMLRGWDDGFETPSLGIAIHPNFRGLKIGDTLMHFLHAAARLRGSRRVRLRVANTNTTAINLYERTGYRFEAGIETGHGGKILLVAYKELGA